MELSSDIEEEEKGGLQGELRAEAKAGVRGWEEASMEERKRAWRAGSGAWASSVRWGKVRQEDARSQKALWASRRV